ncbi:phage terminase large subunit family protein [Cohaesibacter celericrescens]|nr:terminase gpA endonuclease subunit [Cohaesibacter celericrescens]
MPDRGIPNYHRSKGAVPPYVQPYEIIADVIDAARPPMRMSVADAAVEFRRVSGGAYNGPWRHEDAPYLVEPMNMMGSRRFTAMIFIGPARTIKTEGLILNAVAHRIICSPLPMKLIHMTETTADEFSEKKLDVMIEASPEIKRRLGTSRRDSTLKHKRFNNGASVTMGWPTVPHLSGSDWPFIAAIDYDRMPMDVGKEGSPFAMMRKRTQTFGSQGMAALECSPGKPILDETWRPQTAHEAPPCEGGLAEYNTGTRARYYWTCPHEDCQQAFEPDFDDLKYPQDVSPEEARANVVMQCPCCGEIIDPSLKYDLNLKGQWLHEASDGTLVTIDDPKIKDTDAVSYWLKGPCATFQNWSELVYRYLIAKAHLEKTGDDSSLKATVTVDQGKPYLPGGLSDEDELTVEKLKALAEDYPLKIAPKDTRFITIQLDVQKGAFVGQADAWGPNLERWCIDRFDIVNPPSSAPGDDDRSIKPPLYAEDWDALLPLFDRQYEVDGTGFALKPIRIACDSGGEAGVADNAYKFWRKLKAGKDPLPTGLHKRFQLVKGASNDRAKRAEISYPESAAKGRKVASDIPLLFVSRGSLKDAVSASLLREDAGPNKYHLSVHLPDAVFEELSAEKKTAKKGWEKKAGSRANEALDLACYGRAETIVLGAEKIDWSNPPSWAQTAPFNLLAVRIEPVEKPEAEAKPAPAQATAGSQRPARMKLQRNPNFLRNR